MKKIIIALLAATLLVGIAAAVNTDNVLTDNVTFNFEQSVEGSGYFMTYKYIQLSTPDDNNKAGQKGPMLKDYVHGSGSIDNEVLIIAERTYSRDAPSGKDITIEQYSCISMREDNSMVYSPMTIAMGNGYYARNPIRYDSLLKERTCIKNYRPVTSMVHQIEYAKAIDKDLEILVKDKNYSISDPFYEGVGYTSMKITEDVTDGKVHIGVLQGEPNAMSVTGYGIPDTTAWKNPMIEVDEDYIGTYHIEKNMTIVVPYKLTIDDEDWLSCCFGGCADVDDATLRAEWEDCIVGT
ncbi:MAG: hypothetical protein U9N48_08255 [Euryarchaeota archaeon]|nr:hypothetical protein [Euryarchaeota archaeon]